MYISMSRQQAIHLLDFKKALCYHISMKTDIRRQKILQLLSSATEAISASTLANKYKVSRQIIVGDVAILRAEGHDVTATPKGYILRNNDNSAFGYVGTVAASHNEKEMQDELYTIVDFGATVLDVTVEHSVYGQISGKLELSSRYDVDVFINKIKNSETKPLSDLTGGIHVHKIGAPNQEIFDRTVSALKAKGFAL